MTRSALSLGVLLGCLALAATAAFFLLRPGQRGIPSRDELARGEAKILEAIEATVAAHAAEAERAISQSGAPLQPRPAAGMLAARAARRPAPRELPMRRAPQAALVTPSEIRDSSDTLTQPVVIRADPLVARRLEVLRSTKDRSALDDLR